MRTAVIAATVLGALVGPTCAWAGPQVFSCSVSSSWLSDRGQGRGPGAVVEGEFTAGVGNLANPGDTRRSLAVQGDQVAAAEVAALYDLKKVRQLILTLGLRPVGAQNDCGKSAADAVSTEVSLDGKWREVAVVRHRLIGDKLYQYRLGCTRR